MSKDQRPDPTQGIRFEPDRDGLEAVMGPLEAQVMDLVWELGEATVREVWERLGGEEQAAYTTVMTIFHRLHEKGYVEREAVGRAHVYRPRTSRDDFQESVLSQILRGVLGQIRQSQPLGVMGRLRKRDRALLRKMLDEVDGDE